MGFPILLAMFDIPNCEGCFGCVGVVFKSNPPPPPTNGAACCFPNSKGFASGYSSKNDSNLSSGTSAVSFPTVKDLTSTASG